METITKQAPPIRTSWSFVANSVLAGVLGVVIARVVEQFGLAVTGALLGRDPLLTNIATEFRQGGSDLAYAGGPLFTLAVATVLLTLYPQTRSRSAGRLVALWTVLHCYRAGFVSLASVRLDPDGAMAGALATLDPPAGIDVVITAAGVVGLLLVSIAAAPAFIAFSRHRSEVSTLPERVRFVAVMAVLPGLVSPLLALPFFLPDAGTGFTRTLPTLGLFTLLTLAAAAFTAPTLDHPLIAEERTLSWGLVAWTVAVLAVMVVVLRAGIAIPPWDENLQFRLR